MTHVSQTRKITFLFLTFCLFYIPLTKHLSAQENSADESPKFNFLLKDLSVNCSSKLESIEKKPIWDDYDEKILQYCRLITPESGHMVNKILIEFSLDKKLKSKNLKILQSFSDTVLRELKTYDESGAILNKDFSASLIFLGNMEDKRALPFIKKILSKPENSHIGLVAYWAAQKLEDGDLEGSSKDNNKNKKIPCNPSYKDQLNNDFSISGCAFWTGFTGQGLKYNLYYRGSFLKEVESYFLVNNNTVFFQEVKPVKNFKADHAAIDPFYERGQYYLFQNEKLTPVEKTATHFTSLFSSPAVIGGNLFYWGIERLSKAGSLCNLYAAKLDLQTLKLKMVKLYTGNVETDYPFYFAPPYLWDQKIYFLYESGGWALDENLQILFNTAEDKKDEAKIP